MRESGRGVVRWRGVTGGRESVERGRSDRGGERGRSELGESEREKKRTASLHQTKQGIPLGVASPIFEFGRVLIEMKTLIEHGLFSKIGVNHAAS